MCKQSKGYQILFEIKLIEHRRHEELPVDFFLDCLLGRNGNYMGKATGKWSEKKTLLHTDQ